MAVCGTDSCMHARSPGISRAMVAISFSIVVHPGLPQSKKLIVDYSSLLSFLPWMNSSSRSLNYKNTSFGQVMLAWKQAQPIHGDKNIFEKSGLSDRIRVLHRLFKEQIQQNIKFYLKIKDRTEMVERCYCDANRFTPVILAGWVMQLERPKHEAIGRWGRKQLLQTFLYNLNAVTVTVFIKGRTAVGVGMPKSTPPICFSSYSLSEHHNREVA